MPFDAVIFDLDGTLVDSETQALEAGRMAFGQLGHTLDEALFHRLVGTDRVAGEAILRGALGDFDPDALDRAWTDAMQELHERDGVPLKPGARDLVQALHGVGLPVAVATSSMRHNAQYKLRVTGLDGYLTTLVSRDCVTQAKPHPEPYLTAATRLDLAPARCIAFEDSDPGAKSAMAAGMTVVQVRDQVALSGDNAHHLADSLLHGADLSGLARLLA